MRKVSVVTDSTADIPPQIAADLDISIVPCFVMFGDESFLDGVTLTRAQFYARLASSPLSPTTASPSAGAFEEMYARIGRPGDAILSIHLAAALSSVYQVAQLGSRAALAAPVTVYDSASTSMGLGWQVIAAARAARRGESLAEIVSRLDRMKGRVYVLAALDTMEFLRRSGRVGWARALIGQVLDVKPIVRLYQGSVDLVDRVRTRARMLTRLVEMVTSLGPLESLAVLHSSTPAAAARLLEAVAGLAPGEVPVVEVTPIIGVHVGPNGLGLAAVVKTRSAG